jgi:DNA-binding SARP family transcriptional activator/tetratricopeptide (TPR) repeat protein
MLHVSLLGEQAITEDGTSVQAHSSRAIALVAFLAAHAGAPQSRQRIAGTFWPESADAQALTNLRRELHNLRQILGRDSSLVVTSRDLCWCDSDTCRVDLRVFTTARSAALAADAVGDDAGILVHAAAAVECYKGDLLPGVYDEWLLEMRSGLDRQCADLCDLLAAAGARAGDMLGAVQAARRRIQLQPLEDTGYRTLMLLQADLGDRAGAISTYHHCASVLERELGVPPAPVTRQAFQRLITDGAPPGPGPPAAEPAPRAGVAAARLVGRSRELALLGQLWRNAASGAPGLVVIRGGAGVGKSRVASEIATMAGLSGAVAVSSQCFGTSGRLALAPVADWLRHPVVLAASAALDAAWRGEVGRLVPAEGHGAGSGAMVDAWQRHRFFEGLARALMAVGRPMLLILDNMQWCDQETLAFITFFLSLAADTPVLVVGTRRDDAADDDPEMAAWTVRMRATGLLTELSLSPLDAAGTGRLAESISGRAPPAAEADLLHAATGGFPLYIVEAIRGRADAGDSPLPSGGLTAMLRKRLEQASASAREVAGLAAAVGRDFTLDLLTEASDLDAGTVVGAVDELWRRRIMREYREGYDFSHDLLRETAYTLISPPKRWLLHRRVAQALELLHPDDADSVSAQLAEQYARGGRLARAAGYYRRAADIAAARFAHAEAIRLHSEALSIVRSMPESRDRDRQELEVLEAIAAPLNARYGYSSPKLQEVLERSIVLSESLGRKDSTLSGLVALWTTQFVQGRAVEGYQTAKRALALVDPSSEPSGPAHFAVGGSAVTLGKHAEAVRHLELAVRLTNGAALSTGTRADVHGGAFAAHAYWLLGQDDEAESSSEGSISLARAAGDPYNLAVALAYSGIMHQMRDDLPSLRNAVAELRELCERHGFAYYREWALILDGWSRPGASGIDLAQAGISHLKLEGAFARMPYWLSLLAGLLERDSRDDAARATLDAALAAGRSYDDLWWLPEVMRMRAAHDDAAAAGSRLRSAARMASAQGGLALLRRCEGDLIALPSAGVRHLR